MGFLMTTESQDLGLTSHPKDGCCNCNILCNPFTNLNLKTIIMDDNLAGSVKHGSYTRNNSK